MKKLEAAFIRAIIKDSLGDCTDSERLVFKRMYSPGGLDLSLAEIVDMISKRNLNWAMQQVHRTLELKQA